jgi:hypothetical protein
MGGYERTSKPFSLDRGWLDAIPEDFNARLLEPDWERFEEITKNSTRRVPQMEDVPIRKLINGPGGLHAGQRVLPRRDRGPRSSSSRRASAPTASPARAASAR